MPHNKDYIPGPDSEFDGWFYNLKEYVIQKTSGATPAWTHIPAAKVTALTDHYEAWHSAYVATVGPHDDTETAAKNSRRTESEAFIRPFVAQYLKFDPVTNVDRTAMQLHNRDTVKTPVGIPGSHPVLTDLKPLGGFQVQIHFRDELTPDSLAILYGCTGCLLYYAYGPARVTDYAALTRNQLMTHSPWTQTFPPEAEGMFLSCAARWQAETSELGPWSEIQHLVIA